MTNPDSFGHLPIPENLGPTTMTTYYEIPIDSSNPKFNEELVLASDVGLACFTQYNRSDGYNWPYNKRFKNALEGVYLRKSLSDVLRDANEILKEIDLELLLWDGYRTIDTQRDIWAFFIEEAERRLSNPTEKEKSEFAAQFISDPTRFSLEDATSWPVHSTGGAIDLTLRLLESKQPLFMGSVFDDSSILSHTRFFEEKIALEDKSSLATSDYAALQGRRILYHTLRSLGMTNFANEWWHFDWGTQLWSLTRAMEDKNNEKAWYGTAVLEL